MDGPSGIRMIFFLATVLLFTSCVSQKKYNELIDSKARTDRENIRLKEVEQNYEELRRRMDESLNTLQNTEGALQKVKTTLENLQNEHVALQEQYDILLSEKSRLTNEYAEEKKELTALLTVKQTELDDKERIVRRLEQTVYANTDELQEREQQIRELNAMLIKQREGLDSLKNNILGALVDIPAEDLSVEQRDGKVYVSLSQNLLFEKNSKQLDAGGKQTIARVAGILKQQPDIDIAVEGHTDTDGTEAYNWDLSVSRATAVVKELTNSGLSGARITASGRAFYDPVAMGDDEEAKSKNRRTEIILTPRLQEVLDILNE